MAFALTFLELQLGEDSVQCCRRVGERAVSRRVADLLLSEGSGSSADMEPPTTSTFCPDRLRRYVLFALTDATNEGLISSSELCDSCWCISVEEDEEGRDGVACS